jgi:hypothetical protein
MKPKRRLISINFYQTAFRYFTFFGCHWQPLWMPSRLTATLWDSALYRVSPQRLARVREVPLSSFGWRWHVARCCLPTAARWDCRPGKRSPIDSRGSCATGGLAPSCSTSVVIATSCSLPSSGVVPLASSWLASIRPFFDSGPIIVANLAKPTHGEWKAKVLNFSITWTKGASEFCSLPPASWLRGSWQPGTAGRRQRSTPASPSQLRPLSA